MNKENMLRWADALESGEYVQCHNSWGGTHRGAYCCLNVAIVEFTGMDAWEYDDNNSNNVERPTLTKLNELFGEDFSRTTFYTYNDKLRMTFPEIAAKIREMVNE